MDTTAPTGYLRALLRRASEWIRASTFGAIEGLVSNTMLVTATAAASGPTAAVLAGIVGALSNPAAHAVGEYLSVGDENRVKEHDHGAGDGHGGDGRGYGRGDGPGRGDGDGRGDGHGHGGGGRGGLGRGDEHGRGTGDGRGYGDGQPHGHGQIHGHGHGHGQRCGHGHGHMHGHGHGQIHGHGHGHGHGGSRSHVTAALASILSAGVGAAVPVLPYALGAAHPVWGIVAGAAGLVGAGVASSAVTRRRWWQAGLRYLAAGGITGGLSYLGVESVDAISRNPAALLPAVAVPALLAVVARVAWRRRAGRQQARQPLPARHDRSSRRESASLLAVPAPGRPRHSAEPQRAAELLRVRLVWQRHPDADWRVAAVDAGDLAYARQRMGRLVGEAVRAGDRHTALWADEAGGWLAEAAREPRPDAAAQLVAASFARLAQDTAPHLVAAARECTDDVDRRLLGWSNPAIVRELQQQSHRYELASVTGGPAATALGRYTELADVARAAGHPVPPVEAFHRAPEVRAWAGTQPGGSSPGRRLAVTPVRSTDRRQVDAARATRYQWLRDREAAR